jgi:hypothetical protein
MPLLKQHLFQLPHYNKYHNPLPAQLNYPQHGPGCNQQYVDFVSCAHFFINNKFIYLNKKIETLFKKKKYYNKFHSIMKGTYSKLRKILSALRCHRQKGYVTINIMVQTYLDNPEEWDIILNILKESGMKVQIIPGGYLDGYVLRHMHIMGIPVHHAIDHSDYPIPTLNWREFSFDEWWIVTNFFQMKKEVWWDEKKWESIYRYVLRSKNKTDIIENFIYRLFNKMLSFLVVPELHYELKYLDDRDREYVYKSPVGTILEHIVKTANNINYFRHDILSKYKKCLKNFVSYFEEILNTVTNYVKSYLDSLECEFTDNVIFDIMKNSIFIVKLKDLMPSRLKGEFRK